MNCWWIAKKQLVHSSKRQEIKLHRHELNDQPPKTEAQLLSAFGWPDAVMFRSRHRPIPRSWTSTMSTITYDAISAAAEVWASDLALSTRRAGTNPRLYVWLLENDIMMAVFLLSSYFCTRRSSFPWRLAQNFKRYCLWQNIFRHSRVIL